MPNVILVNTSGPQGPVGPIGPAGPSGSVETGSLVTTSSFNAFTSSFNTGSFSGSFIGNLFGTASWAQTASFALTIANGAVTNANLASVSANTIKGRITAGSGNLEDLTASQVRSILNVVEKPIQITGITLVSSSWSLVGGLYEYVYNNANIVATNIVNVIPNNADIDTVIAASILPRTDSAAGSVTIYAKNLPTASIGVTINISNL